MASRRVSNSTDDEQEISVMDGDGCRRPKEPRILADGEDPEVTTVVQCKLYNYSTHTFCL